MIPPASLELWIAPGSFTDATRRGVTITSGPYGAKVALCFPDEMAPAERAAFLAQLAAVVVNESARYVQMDEAQVPAQRRSS